MPKFKVGDVVKPLSCEDGYLHPHLIAGKNYIVEGHTYEGEMDVSGEFHGQGDGRGWDEDWFELVEGGENVGQIRGLTMEKNTSAESLRNSILDIRTEREALQKEILRLDEQEKEAVEKLKEQGFVLYEDNAAKELDVKELTSTENKAVLYAEDIEEDMTNPINWKVGDLLQVISKDVPNILPYGSIQRIVSISGDGIRFTDAYSTCVETVEHITEYFKFHSRPVK